jgi:two-component system response regulator HydG
LNEPGFEPAEKVGREWMDLSVWLQPQLVEGIVGQSNAIAEVVSRIKRLASHKGTVLIQGESGTGKEAVAQAVHRLGPTAAGPLVSFNCSNLVEGLAESQLFGHVKGAFTDARDSHTGCFREANGGTLLLDEIGELPLAMQAKLLRVTENLEVQAVGSPQTFRLDLQLIAATNRDLRRMVADGEFRADLFYRLEVGSIRLPPLRERLEDVPLLAAHFVDRYNRAFEKQVQYVSPRALDALCSYGWPGNVRELAHAIERAIILTDSDRIDLEELPEALLPVTSVDATEPMAGIPSAAYPGSGSIETPDDAGTLDHTRNAACMTLDDAMKAAVQRSLEFARGDCARAARLLGISRPAIYRKMARYGISSASVRQFRSSAPIT